MNILNINIICAEALLLHGHAEPTGLGFELSGDCRLSQEAGGRSLRCKEGQGMLRWSKDVMNLSSELSTIYSYY